MASLISTRISVLLPGALMGFLVCWSFGLAESTCCDLEPPLMKLGPPPKPRWLNLNVDLTCNGSVVIENLYDRTSSGSGNKMSAAQIVPLVIGLLLATGILAFAIIVYYKKRYIKYRVSPERSRADRCPEDGHSGHRKNRSAATMESIPGYRSAINTDKQALVNSTVTSQASLSSASFDTAPLTGPTASSLVAPRFKESKLVEDRASLSSGIGMSHPDLQDSAEPEEAVDAPNARGPCVGLPAGLLHRPISGGQGGLTQVEYNLAQPDIIKSTLNNNVNTQPASLGFSRRLLLPILTPLRSLREPKKSRVIDPDAEAAPRSPRRSSSRQRPLSVSLDKAQSDTPVSPGDCVENSDKPARKSKRDRKKKKRHNFLKGKQKGSVNLGLEDTVGDSSEVLANIYARLPAISTPRHEESCA